MILIVPSAFVAPCDQLNYGHAIFQQPMMVHRLYDWLLGRCRETTLIDAPRDPGRLLVLGGWRTRGRRSREAMEAAVGKLGLTSREFVARLEAAGRPDQIWVTSQATFDRDCVWEAIRLAKDVFPGVPVWLGGVYPSLCPEDARKSGADFVHEGLLAAAEEQTWTARGSFGLVMLGRGCPRRCSYCGWRFVENVSPYHRAAGDVLAEFDRIAASGGVMTALSTPSMFLAGGGEEAEEVLEGLAARRAAVVLLTGIDPHAMTPRRAQLLHDAGVVEIGIPLQTVSEELTGHWRRQTTLAVYRDALAMLRDAGFADTQIHTDVLTGQPEQPLAEAVRTACFVWSLGITPFQQAYAFVPRSLDAERLVAREDLPALSDQHPLLWSFAGSDSSARDYVEYYKLARVLPQLVTRALDYLDPDSTASRLIPRFLDELGFAVPQWRVGALPPLFGMRSFLSHPWELALTLCDQDDVVSLKAIAEHCLAIPVVDARYFRVPRFLVQRKEAELATRMTAALVRAVPTSERGAIEQAVAKEGNTRGWQRAVAVALARTGAEDESLGWAQLADR